MEGTWDLCGKPLAEQEAGSKLQAPGTTTGGILRGYKPAALARKDTKVIEPLGILQED